MTSSTPEGLPESQSDQWASQKWYFLLWESLLPMPSLVQGSGAPFLWWDQPLVVEKIDNWIASVQIIDHRWAPKKCEIEWQTNWPKLHEWCLILVGWDATANWPDPFANADPVSEKGIRYISLISPSGYEFDTLDVSDSLHWDVNTPDFYYTIREEGSYRLFGKPKDNHQRLAKKVWDGWEFVWSPIEQGLNAYFGIWRNDPLCGPYYRLEWGEFVIVKEQSWMLWLSVLAPKTLSWDFGEITHIYVDRNGRYRWTFHGNDICFSFDFERQSVRTKKVDYNFLFLDNNWWILWPENLRNRTIIWESVRDIPGFLGIELSQVNPEEANRIFYTDWRDIFVFQKNPDGSIARYENERSEYNGYPLKYSESLHDWYWSVFRWENGRDYLQLSTYKWDRLFVLGDGIEIGVDPRNRREVSTSHSRDLWDLPRVSWLHPAVSVAVLAPSDSNSSSDLRYYAIAKDWILTYIGSKDNIWLQNDWVVLFQDYSNRRDNTKEPYTIILWEDGENKAFMIWDYTCIPVIDKDKKPLLLICANDGESRYFRSLKVLEKVDIPEDIISDGRILSNADFSNLIEKFPDSDVVFLRSAYIWEWNGFSNIDGTEIHPQLPTDIPQFWFWSEVYYLRHGTFWSPATWNEYTIPNIGAVKVTSWFTEVNAWENKAYVLNKKFTKNDDVRFAIFLWESGKLTWSYVWYDKESNSIEIFTDSEWKAVQLDGEPIVSQSVDDEWNDTGEENRIVFPTPKGYALYDLSTRNPIDIVQIPDLEVFLYRENEIWYKVPGTHYIVDFMDDTASLPQKIKIWEAEWYKLQFESTIPQWNTSHSWSDDVETDIQTWVPVVHLYHPESQTIVPFRVVDGAYIPVFRNIPPGEPVVINGKWVGDFLYETIAKRYETGESHIITEIFFSSWWYALVRWFTINQLLSLGDSRNTETKEGVFFLMYNDSRWESIIVPLPDDIDFKRDGYSWGFVLKTSSGYVFSLQNDSWQLDAWFTAFVEQVLPKWAIYQVSETRNALGTILAKK